MIKKDLQKVIREFLSNNRTSLITEVSDETLDLQQKFFNDMLVNKSKIVQRYGKDAEKVMKGKAMNLAKKETEKMEKQKLKELVRKSLMQEADIEVGAEKFMGEKDLAQASMMLDALEDQLKNHDWFYMMSDDHRAYTKGSVQQSKIRGIMKNLEDIGYGDEAKSLYNQYAPSQFTLGEAAEFSKEYDNNPALKGGQKKLPDALQKSIIAKKGVKEGYYGTTNVESYLEAIGYESFEDFFENNPGGEDALMNWIESVPEFRQSLEGAGLLSEDLDLGHEDNEPHMIKGELYKIGKYAMELYQMVDGFEGKGEVDFPAWWQSKITKACSMIGSAKHYLEFELKEPAIDAMVGVAADEDILDENIGQDEMLAARLYKIKNFVQPAFFKKVRSLINSGDLETAELFISRMEPVAAKNDMEMAKMMGDLEDIDKVEAQRQREKQMANVFTEKKLTKAEKAKKEDIVKGMKKSFKGDESAMYAIATAKAKKVAETIVKKLKND